MNNYPKFVKVNNKKYKINTDFRIALKCDEIAKSDVSDVERTLAIIYLLYGDNGIKSPEDWNSLLEIGLRYLRCNKKIENIEDNKDADMSFKQDWGYIEASFFSDYNLNLSNIQMHWWQFYDLLCGLTEKCVLSRVRFVRNFDISQIKDTKEREKWIEQKRILELKTEKSIEETRLDELFEKQLKGR